MRPRHRSPDDVVVCLARSAVLDDDRAAATALALLGPAERAAHHRLRVAGARRDYLAAHALVRIVVADLLAVEPTSVVLDCVPGRPPRLIAPVSAARLAVSLSHADGLALCAVAADRAIGVDVESLRNVGPDPLGIAATVCSPREMEELRSVAIARRPRHLLRRWVLKEALAKASGEGLLVPARDLARARPTTDAPDLLPRWRLVSWPIPPRHEAAVAFPIAAEDVGVRRAEWHLGAGETLVNVVPASVFDLGDEIACLI